LVWFLLKKSNDVYLHYDLDIVVVGVFKVQLGLLSLVVLEVCHCGSSFFHLTSLSHACRFIGQTYRCLRCCWR